MVMLPLVAMALNSVLVVGVAGYLTDREAVKADQGLTSESDDVAAVPGI